MSIDENVFSFEDFLSGKISTPKKVAPTDAIKESKVSEEQEVQSVSEPNEIETSTEVEKIVQTVEETPTEEFVEEVVENENFYTLYKDKAENFSCDIFVEGAKTDETITRLIVESEDWSLIFPGEIKNGKVTIPIRKLSLFDEGQTGKIRLEVIAEGTHFIPWEDDFKVKLSKKVTVSMNENKKPSTPIKKKEIGVKVNIKK